MISFIPMRGPDLDTPLYFIDEETKIQMVGWLAKVTLESALGSESQGCALDLSTQQISGPRISTNGAAPWWGHQWSEMWCSGGREKPRATLLLPKVEE